jgi:hypothetical protein
MTKMGISNHFEPSKTPLYETHIYERFKRWLENSDEMKVLKDRINAESGTYQRDLIKECREKDFFTTFIVMCKLACQNIDAEEEKIKDVIGYVMGDIIFETTEIPKLNEILKYLEIKDSEKVHYKDEGLMRWIDDRRDGKVWILDTFIDWTIKSLLTKNHEEKAIEDKKIEEIPDEWRMTYGENAKSDFALFSGVSLSEVESMLACGISRTYLHNILYGSIMLRILMDALKDDLYLTWLGDEDLFTGYSGVNHFFDGIIILEENDRENPWLLKCISTYHNLSDAIESIDAKLGDIGVKKCILFVPAYTSQNALRHSISTYSKRKHKIMMLYIHDLYRMVAMEDDEIKGYLIRKEIR